jgi:hypothetical protein
MVVQEVQSHRLHRLAIAVVIILLQSVEDKSKGICEYRSHRLLKAQAVENSQASTQQMRRRRKPSSSGKRNCIRKLPSALTKLKQLKERHVR